MGSTIAGAGDHARMAQHLVGQLGVLAAETVYNLGNVNLVGLAATGLEFT